MKKFLGLCACAAIAATSVLGFAACGGTSYPEDAVVVYVEYNGLTGRDDDKVKEALEKKFEEDTGESISLYVEPSDTGTLGNKLSGDIGSGQRVDAIVTHYSSDSFLNTMITAEKELKDLTELVPQYAPDYLKRFNETSDKSGRALLKGTFNSKIYALSSLELNSVFGMLVNKEHFKQAGYNPDEYDIACDGYKSFTLSEFTQLLKDLKTKVGDGKNRPLTGKPYDIEYFLLPVFESSGYTRTELIGDRLYPAWATDNFCKLLEYERMLQLEKLWTDNPLSSGSDDSSFTGGTASIYTLYPEVTQMIEKARALKKSLGHDCIMLAPLRADGEEVSKGNARHETAFCGLVAHKNGQNTELLLKYVNWLSKKENYELAKYGIEGTHWIATKTADGRDAYAYPEDKRAQYEEHLPYSGIYALLTDAYLSNRVYDGYSETESKWVREVHAFPSYPANGYDDEGINMPSVPRNLRAAYNRLSDEYVAVRSNGWSDVDLGSDTVTNQHKLLVDKLEGEYKAYIDFLTTEYNKIIATIQK